MSESKTVAAESLGELIAIFCGVWLFGAVVLLVFHLLSFLFFGRPFSEEDWLSFETALGSVKYSVIGVVVGCILHWLDRWMKKQEAKKREAIKWFNKGVNLANLGNHRDAIEAFQWALEYNPRLEGAWNNKGVCLADLGRFEEAIECYNKALEINPNFQLALNNRTIAQEKLR